MSCDLLRELISREMFPLLPQSPAPISLMSSLLKSHRGAFVPKVVQAGCCLWGSPLLVRVGVNFGVVPCRDRSWTQ